jgi:hypothetical protein
LLDSGAKLDLNTRNDGAKEYLKEISEEIKEVIEKWTKGERIKYFMKMHKLSVVENK